MPRSKTHSRIGGHLPETHRLAIKAWFRRVWVQEGSGAKAAAWLNISETCFRDVMADRGAISLSVALRAAQALKITVEQLVEMPPGHTASRAA